MNPNAKSPTIWNDPRGSIANSHKNNDMAYATTGAKAAMQIVQASLIHAKNIGEDSLNTFQWDIIEYGSGTSRIARPLSYYFKSVVAYDPSLACYELALKEANPLVFPNITYTMEIPKEDCVANVVSSVNVLEHLEEDEQQTVLYHMNRLCKPYGMIIIWFHTGLNKSSILKTFGSHILDEYKGIAPMHIIKSFTKSSLL